MLLDSSVEFFYQGREITRFDSNFFLTGEAEIAAMEAIGLVGGGEEIEKSRQRSSQLQPRT